MGKEEGRMYVYHVVTERPMELGQEIIFDETHHNGVYQRVMEKVDAVKEIYAYPERYQAEALEHHTSVALRELALEEVRKRRFPSYPSRMGCLYVSYTREEARRWRDFFTQIGRPVYGIVKLEVEGNFFAGDACKCFDGRLDEKENLKLAQRYWENEPDETGPLPVCEVLVDGRIRVVEIEEEEA